MAAGVALFTMIGVSLALMLVRPRGIAEVYWIGGGVAVLLSARLVPLSLAGRAVRDGSDVYLFLTGMMLLSALGSTYGVFDSLAQLAVRHARGSGLRLFTLVYLIGVVVTALLSNDATAVVLTPAVLAAVRKAKAQPLPLLVACAMIANAASFLLPISNPANLVVYHGSAMPPLSRWIATFLLPSVLSIAVTFFILRWRYASDIGQSIEQATEPPKWSREAKLVLVGLLFTVAVMLTASALHRDLGLPACLSALTVVAAVSVAARRSPLPLFGHISWSTLLLVAGLFIMVRAAESHGALAFAASMLTQAQKLGSVAGSSAVAVVIAVGNNLVNNLPLGLLTGAGIEAAKVHGMLSDAALIGVDLGPNLSVTGSLATILWLIALRREGIQVSFGDFLKIGVIAMPMALLASVGGLFLSRLVFAWMHLV